MTRFNITPILYITSLLFGLNSYCQASLINTDAPITNSSETISESTSSVPITHYLIGVGQADITGAAAETGMFGYASGQVVEGINDRLYAHAFIIDSDINSKRNGDTQQTDVNASSANVSSANNAHRVVYVSADMGAMFTAVKQAVVARLQAKYGALYTDDNIMLTATHTHVGNSGYTHQKLYQLASNPDITEGYNPQNFNAVVDGIVTAIERAHDTMTLGTLSLAQGELSGATRNRSLTAYEQNQDANNYDSPVNQTMTQLRFNSDDDKPLGLINWFAVHPTSFSNQFMHLSADNKGYAQLGAQALFDTDSSDDVPFVAAFANADSGDVVASGGNANSAEGFEGSDNEWFNVRRDGQLQLDKATELWGEGQPVYGAVDVRARWIDMEGYSVDGSYTNGAGDKQLCTPARGYSFAAGAENGPSDIHGIYEGMTRESLKVDDSINQIDTSALGGLTRFGFGILSSANQDDCQAEKPVLLPTGAWHMVATKQPVQLMRIGNLAIVAIPAEPTTMVGRRLRASVLPILQDSGIDTVIVNGLANNYSGYLATREEYAVQHYEGASTEFGPYQAAAYRQEYSQLATAMRDNLAVEDLTTPPNTLSQSSGGRVDIVSDNKPINEAWGEVLAQPNPTYQRGETASAQFRGAHPKNNLRTGDTFLKVQRLHEGDSGNKGEWIDYLDDSDFDTTYTWARDDFRWERNEPAYSTVTIEWRIDENTPTGTYRIVHQGDWKQDWTRETVPYVGVSEAFVVE